MQETSQAPKITRNEPFGVVVEAQHPHDDIRDLDVAMLRGLLEQERILVLRGFRTFSDSADFSGYCERWGEVSVWPFGTVLELIERDNPEDHIFDSNYVPMHWDGMYRPQVPELQIFHCVQAPLPGKGGRTTFSDTVSVLANAPDHLKALWGKVTASYERKMEYYASKTIAPIIDAHPLRGYPVIRYNEPPLADGPVFLNPSILTFDGLEDGERDLFFRSLRDAIYAPNAFYAHEWRNGDVVVTDNFSLLHGREGFESKSPRHLQRVHVLSNPPLDNPHLVSHQ